MEQTFNIYCDESCHLEHDRQQAMVLGAVWCPLERTHDLSEDLRRIKSRHGLARGFEIKWTKVSPGKADFYLELVGYFFDNDDLHFRALIVPDKDKLDHTAFPGQDHDVWYYKMYFDMLKVILNPQAEHRIYLDIKDTRGAKKVAKLHEVLCNSRYDFSQSVIQRVQQIRSHEAELLQLADLMIGAVAYANRGLSGNRGKEQIVETMRQRSGYGLTNTTLLKEDKVNLFRWQAREPQA